MTNGIGKHEKKKPARAKKKKVAAGKVKTHSAKSLVRDALRHRAAVAKDA